MFCWLTLNETSSFKPTFERFDVLNSIRKEHAQRLEQEKIKQAELEARLMKEKMALQQQARLEHELRLEREKAKSRTEDDRSTAEGGACEICGEWFTVMHDLERHRVEHSIFVTKVCRSVVSLGKLCKSLTASMAKDVFIQKLC
jgi:hypothetical protein